MQRQDIQMLRRIAGLRLDLRLAALGRATAACSETEARIAEIRTNLELAHTTGWADPRSATLYEAWGEKQQRALNLRLATERAEQSLRREQAARAFGQTEALRQMAERRAKEAALERQKRRHEP